MPFTCLLACLLAEGRHLYLEATSEASRRLYLRHGFEDLGEYAVGSRGPVLFRMARPPKHERGITGGVEQ